MRSTSNNNGGRKRPLGERKVSSSLREAAVKKWGALRLEGKTSKKAAELVGYSDRTLAIWERESRHD